MNKMHGMDNWYTQSPGQMLLALECQFLDRLMARMPGQVLLQIGGCSDLSLARSSLAAHRVYLSLDGAVSEDFPTIVCDLEHLPLQSESVDVVILAHALSSTDVPASVLSQVRAALRPGGQLLIVDFNPWSAWGVVKRFSRRQDFPWQSQFHSISKLKRCLRQVDLQYITAHTLCYQWPWRRQKRWLSTPLVETLGSLLLPGCGGVYMILAQKQAPGMTPLVDAWAIREKNKLMANWPSASARRNIE